MSTDPYMCIGSIVGEGVIPPLFFLGRGGGVKIHCYCMHNSPQKKIGVRGGGGMRHFSGVPPLPPPSIHMYEYTSQKFDLAGQQISWPFRRTVFFAPGPTLVVCNGLLKEKRPVLQTPRCCCTFQHLEFQTGSNKQQQWMGCAGIFCEGKIRVS
jgi:hypothetical protein